MIPSASRQDLRNRLAEDSKVSPEHASFPHLYDLWILALDEYEARIGVDLRDGSTAMGRRLATCSSGEDIIDALQGTATTLSGKQFGGRVACAIRGPLEPVILGLRVLLDAGADIASSSGVPCGNAIFAAISTLLQAADRMSARIDDLVKLFKQYEAYVKRLCIRVRAAWGGEVRVLAVEALAEMLKAFMLATKLMKKNRTKQFIKPLVSKDDEVRNALAAFDGIVSEEERLNITEIVVGMHKLILNAEDTLAASTRS